MDIGSVEAGACVEFSCEEVVTMARLMGRAIGMAESRGSEALARRTSAALDTVLAAMHGTAPVRLDPLVARFVLADIDAAGEYLELNDIYPARGMELRGIGRYVEETWQRRLRDARH